MRGLLYLLIFILSSYQIAFTQSYIPTISTFTTEDGLSSNEVHAIHKDTRGFMWIGTQYGLNRFDGQEFKIYTKENGSGLGFNIINKIMEDEDGNLWLIKTNEKYEHIFTTVEINLFNTSTGEIIAFEDYFGKNVPFALEDISYIRQLDDQSIFIHCAKTKMAFSLHSATGFQSIPFPKSIEHIQGVLLKENGNLLVVGFDRRNPSNLFEINPKGKIIQEGFPTKQWRVYNKEQSYHLTTWGNLNLEAFNHFPPAFGKSPPDKPLNSSILQTNYNPSQQLFWLKKRGNLLVIKPNGQIIYQHENIHEHLGEMPILFDGTTTWFSNKKNGLVALSLEPNHFQTFQFFKKPIDNSMRGIINDDMGTLWFSTIYGMGRMDLGRQVRIINTDEIFSPFLKDKKGNIWYQGQNGSNLVRFNVVHQQQTSFPVKMNNFLWSLFEADNGEIWFNTSSGSLHALTPQTGEIFLKATFPWDKKMNFNIYHFQKRDEHSVWVCTNQGLFLIDWNGKILANFNDKKKKELYLPAKDIHHLYQSDEDKIWVATGDAGLFELSIKLSVNQADDKQIIQSGSLIVEKQYTTENGLSSNALHAIYADDFDYLWISSDNGLMQFDKRNGQISKYFRSNGLAHDEFNRIAHYQGNDGKLYFGGLHGLSVFDPTNFPNSRDKKQAPVLAIADYHQFSGEKKVFEDLTASLLQRYQITLQPNDRFFKLKLALLDFETGKNSTYHYRIKGLYDWQSTANNELSINSIPYGNHLLEIKAQNGNRQNSANTLSITVNVLRPFYLRWWFLALSLVLIGLGIWGFFKRRAQQLLVQQEANQLKNLDKMKSRFFANISHELRTPLTLIGLPLQHLMKKFDEFSKEEAMQYLQSAHSNKEHLNQLINEILDLSKLESGNIHLEKETIVLKTFLERVVNVFQTSAFAKNINFQFFSTINEKLTVNLDPQKLEMVINNLLSNALKFTPEEGTIVIHAKLVDSKQIGF